MTTTENKMNAYEQVQRAQQILVTKRVSEQERQELIKRMIDATNAIYSGKQFN
jgi:hypothetical protein